MPIGPRTWLVAAFSGMALLLAGIGIFGVIAYSVAQRTHEIGVRAALGASRRRVMVLVIRHALVLVAAGLGTRHRGRECGHVVHVEPAVRRATERCGPRRPPPSSLFGLVGLFGFCILGPPRRGDRSARRFTD